MEPIITRYSSVDYTEEIREKVPVEPHLDGYRVSGYTTRTVGKKRMRCKVEVTINLADIIRYMGSRAAGSKTGKCRDGHVTVKRVGAPEELSREVN